MSARFDLPIDYLTSRPEAVLHLGELTVVRHQTGARSANNHVRISVPMMMTVTSGRKTIEWNDRLLQICAGDAVFVTAGAYRMSEEDDHCAALLVFFEPEIIARFRERHPDPPPPASTATRNDRAFQVPLTPFFKSCLESLALFLSTKPAPSARLVEHKLDEMVLLLLEADVRVWPELIAASKDDRSFVRQIGIDPARRRSVLDLARESGHSLASFKRRFRAATGTTPAAWLRERRLARAKLLLETTSRTVTDIALGVGYASVSHFARAFHHVYRVTPQTLRKRTKTVKD